MNTAIITLLVLLSACLLLLFIFFIQKQKRWYKRHSNNETINNKTQILEKRLNELTSNYQKLLDKKLSTNQALIDFLKLKNYKYEFDKNLANLKARQIILDTIDNNVYKVINETSTASIRIDEQIKPKIIGTKGKHIDFFKKITKTDIKIEQKAPFVTISSSNSVRRHLAICIFKHMVKSNAFDIKAIENIYKKEAKIQIESFEKIGKNYIVNKLQLFDINPKLYEYVGRLQYRTSYSQNVLGHCYECALLAEKMAKQLGLDPYIAKMCAFFHDLGKSIDQEDGSYNHVNVGIQIANKCHLPTIIINVIKNHHSKYAKDPYVVLTKIADTISAGISGARTINQEVYAKAKLIEDICINNKFVYDAKTIKGNNFVNVIITKNYNYQSKDEVLEQQLTEELTKNSELKNLKISFTFQ